MLRIAPHIDEHEKSPPQNNSNAFSCRTANSARLLSGTQKPLSNPLRQHKKSPLHLLFASALVKSAHCWAAKQGHVWSRFVMQTTLGKTAFKHLQKLLLGKPPEVGFDPWSASREGLREARRRPHSGPICKRGCLQRRPRVGRRCRQIRRQSADRSVGKARVDRSAQFVDIGGPLEASCGAASFTDQPYLWTPAALPEASS